MKYMIYLLLSIIIISESNAQEIYYVSEQGSRGRDIYCMKSTNDQHQKLTSTHNSAHYPHNNFPKLSPDRSKIVYQSDPDRHDSYSIWIMNTDGSQRKRLTQNEGMFPTWSPDGNTIYFSGRRSGIWEIISVPANGGPETNISDNKSNGVRPGWGATLAATKEFLYFSYVREKVLLKLDLESKEIKKMSSSGNNYTHPVLSPDESKLLLNKKGPKGYNLVIYDLQSGKEKLITSHVVSYSPPCWSRDGSQILFTGMVNGKQELFKIDLTTKQESQLTRFQDFTAMPVW